MIASIIIPVYNVEKYLIKCLDSIQKIPQDLVEVLLINDGSTDNSKEICEEYVSKNINFKLFNKINGGLSNARNYGLKKAIGEYIIFIDSDDFIETNVLIKIISTLNNLDVDVVLTPFYEYIEHFSIKKSGYNNYLQPNFIYHKEDIIKELFIYTSGLWTAWKYIVKKAYLIDNSIIFKEGYLHEDVDYTTRILLNMNTFIFIDNPFYYYRLNRADSIMNTRSIQSLIDICNIIIDLYQYIEVKKQKEFIDDTILSRLSETFFYSLSLYKNGSINEKEIIIELLKSNRYILEKSNNRKHKSFVFISKIIGIKYSLTLYSYLIRG
ncbi:glycosyltransferase family 2 protein [Turicibacter sanguinis]|uniref:glycosyltransferase family 2 protein n=1 Tax=Turicibacter sanguinis TaxID=154288 RepID=UPI00232F4856|nr:glycosyltransferase family 2 protein [Turicibacter sanguinis]MDB8460325.1 glycosyltransferase family 2 protein [Turicibacter sanguinis]